MINELTTQAFVAIYALFVAYNNDDDSKNAFWMMLGGKKKKSC